MAKGVSMCFLSEVLVAYFETKWAGYPNATDLVGVDAVGPFDSHRTFQELRNQTRQSACRYSFLHVYVPPTYRRLNIICSWSLESLLRA